MTITSKFAGTCKNCGTRIAVGEQINWERDQGAKHIQCPQVSRERAWITSQPKNVQDAYRLSAEDKAELAAIDRSSAAAIEAAFVARWPLETTIEARARWNAAKVRPSELEVCPITGQPDYCARLDISASELKQAIRHHGL